MATREIKFRGYATKANKMIDLKAITPMALSDGMLEEGDGLFIPFREDIILMQYIGLKDKNGVEIYEGDIVAVPNRKLKAKKNPTYITEIVYRGHGFVLKYNDTYFNEHACITKSVEVIGNIYTNP